MRNQEYPPFYVVGTRKDVWVECQCIKYGLPYKRVMGQYKGEEETSFIILHVDNKTESQVWGIAHHTSQACVLFVDSQRNTYVLDVGKRGFLKPQPMGKWEGVSKSFAILQDGYTYDATTDSYYVASGGK